MINITRHLENSKSRHISTAVRAISTTFDTMTQFDLLDRSYRLLIFTRAEITGWTGGWVPQFGVGDSNANCPSPDFITFQNFKYQTACITMQ